MSETDEPVEQEENKSDSEPEPEASDEIKESPSTLDEDNFQKYLKGADGDQFAKVLGELAQSNKIAAVYIDARSGGVFFQGNAQIGGNVVGRDQVKTGKQDTRNEQAAVGHILVTDLKKINAVYIESQSYQAAKEILDKRYLVILHGRAHTGKWTTAIHLLDKFHPKNVIELDPVAKLDQLIDSIVVERGYVVDNMSVEEVENLTPFSLTRLSEKLHEKKSHLVITIDEKNNLSSNISTSYTIVWDANIDVNHILEKHLDWYAPDVNSEQKDTIQGDENVRSLLNMRLLTGEVDQLAELLGMVLNNQLNLATALDRYVARTRDQVKAWFDENNELDDRLFMLSVAVFNGASYQAIADAEKRLKSFFPDGENSTSSTSVFGTSRSQRIRRVGAQLKQGFAHNILGKVPVEIVELDNPNMQPAVLQYAWDEFGALRDIIVNWLNTAASNPSYDVRMRAAAAVGELSKIEFNDICSKILLSWAKDEDSGIRVSAAMALGIPAWNSETAPFVLKLLHHWSTINNWRLCWTACAAYGGLVGIRFPDAALRDLHQIAKSGDLRLIPPLSHSMKNLFDAGELVPQYRLKVIESLVAWTEKVKTTEGILGLFIFLNIAERSWQKADPEGDDWPTLLRFAKKEDILAEQIVALWAKAFNTKASRAAAFAVLEGWLKITQKDMRLEDDCFYLVKGIADKEGVGKEGRMLAYLMRWKANPDTEEIATKILNRMQ